MSFLPRKNKYVPPFGSKAARICLIGEAPGAVEVQKGMPFCGPAGSVLNDCLSAAQISRRDCYITNTIKEKPDDLRDFWKVRKKGTNEYHEWTEQGEAQLEQLLHELEQVEANVFVTIGRVPSSALLGLLKITEYRGYVYRACLPSGRQIKVIPTIHPASVLRGGKWSWKHYIAHDLLKAKRLSKSPEIGWTERKLVTDLSFSETRQYLRELRGKSPLSFDIEVSNWEVSCLSFSVDPLEAISINLYRAGNGQPRWSEEEELTLWQDIALVLEDKSTEKVAQNGIFDVQFLANKMGILPKGKILDTMIAHSLMYPDFEKGLGFLASIHTENQWYWKSMVSFKNPKKEA